MSSRSMPPLILPESSGPWRAPATTLSASVPAASRNGPMCCRESWPPWKPRHDPVSLAVSFPDLVPGLRTSLPELRGRLIANQPLSELTWFRVGGPAQVLFLPEDESDLAYFVQQLPREVAVTVIGLGSNLIVRDGGVPGVVIRLGRGFNQITVASNYILRAGAAAPDIKVAQAAQEAGIDGLAFLRGIPGSVGGALRMNGGAYGRETKDVLIAARGVDRAGTIRTFANADMH